MKVWNLRKDKTIRKWFLLSLTYLFASISMASPLPANDAFQVNVKLLDPNNLSINWQIKPGYFLYSERIKVKALKNNEVQLGTIRLPTPLKKTDKLGRTYTVYRDQLSLTIPILSEQPGESLIAFTYQGCSDDGFCYPKESKEIKLSINPQLAMTNVSLFTDNNNDKTTAFFEKNQTDPIESIFSSHHWLMILLSFFGFGLLLAFTPCVLPMVPVLSGIIIGHGDALSTRKAFFLSLSYVLSMAATYAIVGAIVSVLGSNLQIIMQSPWAIGLFSALFALLSLSMFGYFELKLPVSWQARLAKINRNQGSGHYIGAAIMGCLSTLILSPCVTAPLIGALGYIAHSGNVLLGSLSLFFLGLGMGTPLLIIGTSAGRWLPKAGIWMNGVKAFFGVLLLAVAISLLDRILPSFPIMLLWACLFIFSGVYLGALLPSYSNQEKFRQGTGILLLGYGLLLLIGASMGNTNPLQPLITTPITSRDTLSLNTPKVNAKNLKQALENAKGKPVMLDFYADWCASCKVMEATTLSDPQVASVLKQFNVIKIDITENNQENRDLLSQYHVIAPPTFLFFDKEGKELTQARLVGEINSKNFLKHLISIDKSV